MPYFFLGKNYLSQSPTHVGNYYGGTLSTVLAKISWCFLFFRLHNPQLLNPPSIKGNFIDKKSKFPLRQIEAKITLDVRPKKKSQLWEGPKSKKNPRRLFFQFLWVVRRFLVHKLVFLLAWDFLGRLGIFTVFWGEILYFFSSTKYFSRNSNFAGLLRVQFIFARVVFEIFWVLSQFYWLEFENLHEDFFYSGKKTLNVNPYHFLVTPGKFRKFVVTRDTCPLQISKISPLTSFTYPDKLTKIIHDT